jgi:hypothetical protein
MAKLNGFKPKRIKFNGSTILKFKGYPEMLRSVASYKFE